MTQLPDEMVAAWLKRLDAVLTRGGGEPTWNRLVDALKEIGQTGIAEDIRRKCQQTLSMEMDSSRGMYWT